MLITEVGLMGVKPNLDVMNDETEEGKILTGVYKFVTSTPGGPSRVYWGLEVKNPLNLWAWFDWDSVEQHEKFAKKVGGVETELAASGRHGHEIVKDLPKILTHGEFSKHVVLKPAPPLVLKSPITEVMLAFFPANISQSTRDAATARFEQFVVKALHTCADVEGVSSGWGVENDFPIRDGEQGQKGSHLTALIGWPRIEAHLKFRETPEFKDNVALLTEMEGLIKLTMVHVRCRSLERSE